MSTRKRPAKSMLVMMAVATAALASAAVWPTIEPRVITIRKELAR